MKKLLIIDPQVCFCLREASLPVQGAFEDMSRLAGLITAKPQLFNSIDVSLDMHQRDHIAHPMFWADANGNQPNIYTQITRKNLQDKVWTPVKDNKVQVDEYLSYLESAGGYIHTIWPEHAMAGTNDANIVNVLLFALNTWTYHTGNSFHTHIKGMERLSEHYGIFKGEGPYDKFNHRLVNELFHDNSEVYIAGEAKSHCVAISLKQIMTQYPQFIPQITLISDATSNVDGFEHVADSIYEALEKAGMKTTTTEELVKSEVHV